jgi:hypothetical protein
MSALFRAANVEVPPGEERARWRSKITALLQTGRWSASCEDTDSRVVTIRRRRRERSQKK